MKKLIFLLLVFFSLAFPGQVLARENNKFGIHITQTEDLDKAAELVNSSGGDWGFVTVVIRDDEQDHQKWQKFFDLCREKHLIPLVRIATHLEGEAWAKPELESLQKWADFLGNLNWPIQSQFVIIFNEPNHAKEWGGKIDPEEYALVLAEAIRVFKNKNPNFFILNAGLDQAAPNSSQTMDEAVFLQKMANKVPDFFNRLDGWASHSYPNHGFIGKPDEIGKASIKGYEWELDFLKEIGLKEDLSVFITESGWPWKQNKKEAFFDQKTVANYTREAFEKVWLNDGRVVAVTPFILNYPFYPFSQFSWFDSQGQPCLHFNEVKNLPKVKGEPVQAEEWELLDFSSVSFLPTNFNFTGKLTLKNTGQSIWGEKPFQIKAESSQVKISDLTLPQGKMVKPGEKAEFDFSLETPSNSGNYQIGWEGVKKAEMKVFEVWKLTNKKQTVFNQIFGKILNLFL